MHQVEAFTGSRNHALACQILGEATLQLEENEEALRWCEAAHRGGQALHSPDLVSGSLRFMAQALSRLGRADEALAAAREALAVAEGERDWHRVATIRHALAEIARRHGPAWRAPAASPTSSRLRAGAACPDSAAAGLASARAAYEVAGAAEALRACASQARAREQRPGPSEASATSCAIAPSARSPRREHQRVL
jgi:hypothetical protein